MQPEDVVNRMLDAIGLPDRAIGSLEGDGTAESEAARRIYGPLLRQLLRAAHWSFARKHGELQLLASRSGTDPRGNPVSNLVEWPWLYAYAWPIDGVRPRWMPWSGNAGQGSAPPGNIALPAVPLMANLNQASSYAGQVPARFLLSTSSDFPVLTGQTQWDSLPDLDAVEGVGLHSRRIVLTNVPPWIDGQGAPHGAALVYTALSLEPELWDSLFAEAMVATGASRLALPLLVDKNATPSEQAKQRAMAVGVRNSQIAIAKDAITAARVASANEAGFPQSINHTPDWLQARTGGLRGPSFGGGGGPGVLSYGWEGMSFGDGGSVF